MNIKVSDMKVYPKRVLDCGRYVEKRKDGRTGNNN